jgi:hypothetical protein
MTVTCPDGHESATIDYCDQCGLPIEASVEPAASTLEESRTDEADTSPASRPEPCPACGAPRSGADRFCESCGYDFLAPLATWEALVTADQEQFERFAVPGLSFPDGYVERRFPLDAEQIRIGRSRGQSAQPAPEIDLSGSCEDPAVSRLHAILERQADGSYAVRDLGSSNGTTVNDDPSPVGVDSPVRLADGDRIRLGAWTTITLRSR